MGCFLHSVHVPASPPSAVESRLKTSWLVSFAISSMVEEEVEGGR